MRIQISITKFLIVSFLKKGKIKNFTSVTKGQQRVELCFFLSEEMGLSSSEAPFFHQVTFSITFKFWFVFNTKYF
jgi:hypothetical protein